MAKKRKSGGGRSRAADRDNDNFTSSSSRRFKMNVNSYMDVANSEDEWDHERDKLLLDEEDAHGHGPARKRQRRLEEAEAALEDSEAELLAGLDEDDDEEDEDEEVEEEDEEDYKDQVKGLRQYQQNSKKLGNNNNNENDDDGDGDDDGDDDRQPRPEDEEGWGYEDAYGADVAENEEDAREIEAEALRLQKKRLEALTEADFGFDETEWLGVGDSKDDEDGEVAGANDANGSKVTELLPLANVTKDTPPEEQQRILRLRYPEFEPLAREFQELQKIHKVSLEDANKQALRRQKRLRLLPPKATRQQNMSAAEVKHSALSSYLGALAMYFALLTSPAADVNGTQQATPLDPKELREHHIMESLMLQRQLWQDAQDCSESESEASDVDLNANRATQETTPEPADLPASEMSVYFTPQEESFADRLPKEMRMTTGKQPAKLDLKAKKLSKAEEAKLRARTEREARVQKLLQQQQKSTLGAASVIQTKSISSSGLSRSHGAADDTDSDFADETSLNTLQAQEKDRRRKSLRFYTSQIAQKANRRGAAARDGGDEDIPYRERIKDKVARLNAEAEARGRKAGKGGAGDDTELGGASSDDEDRATAAAVRSNANGLGDGEVEEDYYQTIASSKARRKADKAARLEGLRQAALAGSAAAYAEGEGQEGNSKRAIGRTIEKNRGLTQARRKEVRNPRVKKRMRFEAKTKKLASMRPVYKHGGEGRGGYAGELTGIKKGIVRSTKL